MSPREHVNVKECAQLQPRPLETFGALLKTWAKREFFWLKGVSQRQVQVINSTSWRRGGEKTHSSIIKTLASVPSPLFFFGIRQSSKLWFDEVWITLITWNIQIFRLEQVLQKCIPEFDTSILHNADNDAVGTSHMYVWGAGSDLAKSRDGITPSWWWSNNIHNSVFHVYKRFKGFEVIQTRVTSFRRNNKGLGCVIYRKSPNISKIQITRSIFRLCNELNEDGLLARCMFAAPFPFCCGMSLRS
jgi:hypothetical protein